MIASLSAAAGVVLSSACASPPPPRPAYAFTVIHRVPSPYKEVLTGRFVQTARPTACGETMQPAIADLEGTPPVPVWTCAVSCAPGEEYVTFVENPGGVQGMTSLYATCTPLCSEGTHRSTYIEPARKAHCAPGTPPPEEARAEAAEQARIRELRDGLRETAYRKAEQAVMDVERRPTPWSSDALGAYARADDAIRALGDWDEERPHEDALWTRLAKLERFRDVAAEESRQRSRMRKSAKKCHESCAAAQVSCLAVCEKLPGATCDSCPSDFAACDARCPNALP